MMYPIAKEVNLRLLKEWIAEERPEVIEFNPTQWAYFEQCFPPHQRMWETFDGIKVIRKSTLT